MPKRSEPIFYRHHVTCLACSLGILLLSKPAHATFSIIAVDTNSGEMGSVVVSCVGKDFDLSEVVVMQPHVGAVVAQSYFYAPGRDLVFAQLREGVGPDSAIAAALDPGFDPPGSDAGPSFRQYAAVSTSGTVSTFTGEDCLSHAGHLSGHEGSFAYAIQGNILTGEEVLSTLQSAFTKSKGRVGMRLIEALRAVGSLGKGDDRCSPLTGDAGYFELHVPGEISNRNVEPTLNVTPLLSIKALSRESEITLVLADRAEEQLATLSDVEDEPEDEPRVGTRRASSGCSLQRGTNLSGSDLLLVLAFSLFLRSRRLARRNPPLIQQTL